MSATRYSFTAAGLTTTNLYFTNGAYSGWLEKTIALEIGCANTFTYTNGLVHAHTDERGLTVTNTWDALQRLRRMDYPDGTFVTNTYTRLDLVQTVDRLGHTNRFGYDALRRLTDVTNTLGAVTHYEYCTCGSLESVTDALNHTTSFGHDLAGRLLSTHYADGLWVSNRYDLAGQLIEVQDSAGTRLTNTFNNQGLLVAASNQFGQVFRYSHDVRDHVTNSVDAAGVNIATTHDDLGRVLSRTYPDDGRESFVYSERGLIRYTNQLEQVTRYGYDAALRRTAETNANSEVTRFSYSPAGDLLTLTDGKDQLTTWNHDREGRVTNKVDAASTEIFRYTYDPNGRLTNRWSLEKGNTGYAYDAVDNLTNVNYPASPDIALGYDRLNRLTNMVDAVGATRYTYTAGGLLESEDGPWADDTVSYTYDNRLRASLSLQQPSASAWAQSYGYDTIKRLTNVTSPAGVFGYDYNVAQSVSPASMVRKLSLPGGSYITNTFDSVARLLSTQLRNSSQAVLNLHSYSYNLGNQRTQRVFTAGNTVDYAYDSIGQLTGASGKESGGTTRLHEQLSYGYDAAHNLNWRTNNALVQQFSVDNLNELTTATRSGTLTVVGTTTSAATNVTVNSLTADIYADHTFAKAGFTVSNGLDSFTAIAKDSNGRQDTDTVLVNLSATNTFVHDGNGNLTSDGQRSFAYDDENQLVSVLVTNAWKSEFGYDGKLRRRVRKEYSWTGSAWSLTNEVRYLYDGLLVIQERDGSNIPRITYTRGLDLSGTSEGAGGIGGLLARTDAAQAGLLRTAFYHNDGNGNVTALVSTNGLVVARYHYDPYGNTLAANGPLAEANVYRFSSKEWHANAGLYYYGYRFYEPNLQRWPNRDPLAEWASLNLFEYVTGDPVNRFDLFGLSPQDVKRIRATSRTHIEKMTTSGERSGHGPLGAALNNLIAGFSKKRVGCAEQSSRLLTPLTGLNDLDDTWTFTRVRTLNPIPHQFVIAHSDNPTDPTLIVDPSHNEIRQFSEPTMIKRLLVDAPEVFRVSPDGRIQRGEVRIRDAVRLFFGGTPRPVFD